MSFRLAQLGSRSELDDDCAVNDSYELWHSSFNRTATLLLRDRTIHACIPPATESLALSFETTAEAEAALDAELDRLEAEGWSILEVANLVEADDDDLLRQTRASFVTHRDYYVNVNASYHEVTALAAEAILRNELECCEELVISQAQAGEPPRHESVEPWCAALAKLGSNSLLKLVVDTYFQPLTRQASVYCGDITDIFEACPKLAFAYVIGAAELRSLAHESLYNLTWMADPMGHDTLASIWNGPLPNLSSLSIGLSYEHGATKGIDEVFLRGLARGAETLPALTELHIAYPEDGAGILEGVVRSPIFDTLRVLSVQGNVFQDEDRGLAILTAHRGALSKLEQLYLPLEDVMSRDDDQLAELIPGILGTDALSAFGPNWYREFKL